ncbi:restriction endonuclease subunit S [Bacteroides xylanisolvens]|uniref:Restriction endonuclease subunit S n=1 Tax=Bacteroides xylanisolvens TaxID=371601 RepID=A0A6A2S1V1_9BACE|nr:restriction endonuclease subunit S [Bacteroides xylanisolvens]KAB6107085.1 restriction endonuclease subunit S [Bacteroides xylanisolvens]KAB6119680.1 restriction endonuclease subunit S [Bacteroides xylanisolvens]KAB6138001.1 restriction endonuclease subunit S [Bacteroides xylanisolvens]KAB6157726.1 restriction endonuclease subunit S [Bacteroides xylanisolvens]MCS3376947.1 restriction endonuclease subunit S [Bacteroides xylanisolvens]
MDTKKLRQKILDLAIRGKLVPQDPNDEPASVLLERIKEEKERLIKEGKIRKSKRMASSDMPHYENVPFEVPESWMWTTIEEICSKIGSGSTPRGSNYSANGIPFFRSQNVYNDRLVYDDIKYISEEVHQKMKGTEVLANDLLLNITGGSLGRCAVVPADFNCGNVSQHVCIIRSVLVEPEYFHALVLSSYFAKSMRITGSGREGLPKYNLEQMGFPLPPLTEQQRIVAEIEHWFALIDQIEQGKADLQTIIKQTKSKILDLAIHGKLVPQDPNDEPAIELLKRINPGFTPCDNGHYPKGWQYVFLGDIFNHNTGKALNSSNKEGIMKSYLTTSNVYWNEFDFTVIKQMPYRKSELNKCTVTKGDLLVCEGGDIGRSAIWNFDYDICIQNHIHRLRAKGDLCVTFYYYVLVYLKENNLIGGKGIGLLGLSSNALHKINVPLPPLIEQQRIVQKIEELFSSLDDIQKSLEV